MKTSTANSTATSPRTAPMVTLILALGLTLGGCAVTSHQSSVVEQGVVTSSRSMLARAAEPGPVRLTRVVAADWAVDRSGLINLEHPEAVAAGLEDGKEAIQIYFYALEHPTQGTYLVDTGVAEAFRDPERAPVSWAVASAMNFPALAIHTDTGQWLARHGEIEGVFLTHLHLDHIMGLPDVPRHVPVYTGPGEAAATGFLNMFVQGTSDELLEGFGPLREWAFEADPDGQLDGVLDVFGDGSVYAIHAPGHTPGSTAYLVRTPEGPQLLVGDASHTAWGWEHGVEPGTFNHDGEVSARSLGRLQALVAALPGIKVHLGHQHHGEEATARR